MDRRSLLEGEDEEGREDEEAGEEGVGWRVTL
jgi:hypothetical protein